MSSVEDSFDGLVSAPAVTTEADRVLVVPGMPEGSYLLNKLTDTAVESNSEYPDAEAMPGFSTSLIWW